MLLEMLQKNTLFKQLEPDKQRAFAILANAFEQHKEKAIYQNPHELTVTTGKGSPDSWKEFLQLDPVKAYINAEMSFLSEIAVRKNMAALAKEAQQGDTQAAKIVNEMSGILTRADSNKVVVLHQIQRPKIAATPTEEATTTK